MGIQMNALKYPVNIHEHYHAHVYFEQATLEFAKDLCDKAGNLFNFKIGRIHEKPIGPHLMWSCQIAFSSNSFEMFSPWLEENRQNLSILVHGLTGNNLQDHTEFAYWLGEPVDLTLDLFLT